MSLGLDSGVPRRRCNPVPDGATRSISRPYIPGSLMRVGGCERKPGGHIHRKRYFGVLSGAPMAHDTVIAEDPLPLKVWLEVKTLEPK